MYKLQLILRYLLRRRIAWVSLIAVMLCTTMILVVLSVMGGWLRTFREINNGLGGDVVIFRQGIAGFDHYPEILDAVRKLPQVKAAVPVIRTYGLVNVWNQITDTVEVVGYGDLDQLGQVNSFKDGLYWQQIGPAAKIENDPKLSRDDKARQLAALKARPPSFDKPLDKNTYQEQWQRDHPKSTVDGSRWDGIIMGTNVIIHKKADGSTTRSPDDLTAWVQLTVLDLGSGSDVHETEQVTRPYWIVDDCRTGFYPVDSKTVYVPFDQLQKDVGMTAKTNEDGTVDLARVNEIQIKLKDGVNVDSGRDAVAQTVKRLQDQWSPFGIIPLQVQGWEEKQAAFLSAVEHEKVLMMFLFGIMSIVSILLVFCIFFMIVVEKTRDIGIIKSVGANSFGIAQIFLGYGLIIGILGAGTGWLASYLIVHNINELHALMGRLLHVKIWDPETYLYDTIPNTMDPRDIFWIVTIAILSAVLGAVVPAIRAARMQPVEALRWE